jgi:hypothetical protein
MINALRRQCALNKFAVCVLRRLPTALQKRRNPFGNACWPKFCECNAAKVRPNEAVGATAILLQRLCAALERFTVRKVAIEKLRDGHRLWRKVDSAIARFERFAFSRFGFLASPKGTGALATSAAERAWFEVYENRIATALALIDAHFQPPSP